MQKRPFPLARVAALRGNVVPAFQFELQVQETKQVLEADDPDQPVAFGDEQPAGAGSLHLAEGLQGVGIRRDGHGLEIGRHHLADGMCGPLTARDLAQGLGRDKPFQPSVRHHGERAVVVAVDEVLDPVKQVERRRDDNRIRSS